MLTTILLGCNDPVRIARDKYAEATSVHATFDQVDSDGTRRPFEVWELGGVGSRTTAWPVRKPGDRTDARMGQPEWITVLHGSKSRQWSAKDNTVTEYGSLGSRMPRTLMLGMLNGLRDGERPTYGVQNDDPVGEDDALDRIRMVRWNSGIVVYTLGLDKTTHGLREAHYFDGGEEVWTRVYERVDVNISVPESLLELTAPAGAKSFAADKVIDRMDSYLHGRTEDQEGTPGGVVPR